MFPPSREAAGEGLLPANSLLKSAGVCFAEHLRGATDGSHARLVLGSLPYFSGVSASSSEAEVIAGFPHRFLG